MSFLSSISQDSWDNAAIIGGAMVALGVSLEIFDLVSKIRNRKKSVLHKDSTLLLWVEFASIALVVGGIALEIFATHRSGEISRNDIKRLTTENNELTEQLDSTTRTAGEAIKQAAVLNNRASSNELQVAVLSNETIRLSIDLEGAKSNSLVLLNELEQREMPMDFSNLSMARSSLGKIPRTNIMLINIPDPSAAYTASVLARAFKRAGWTNVESSEQANSCLGIYIGVNGWNEPSRFITVSNFGGEISLSNYFTNYVLKALPLEVNLNRAPFPNFADNPCEQIAFRLLKILIENGIPARIGPPNFGISIPANSIMIVVGKRPDPLWTKIAIRDGTEDYLRAEEWEIAGRWNAETGFSQDDRTNLDRIEIEKSELFWRQLEMGKEAQDKVKRNRIPDK